jgi:hypothetical protein
LARGDSSMRAVIRISTTAPHERYGATKASSPVPVRVSAPARRTLAQPPPAPHRGRAGAGVQPDHRTSRATQHAEPCRGYSGSDMIPKN